MQNFDLYKFCVCWKLYFVIKDLLSFQCLWFTQTRTAQAALNSPRRWKWAQAPYPLARTRQALWWRERASLLNVRLSLMCSTLHALHTHYLSVRLSLMCSTLHALHYFIWTPKHELSNSINAFCLFQCLLKSYLPFMPACFQTQTIPLERHGATRCRMTRILPSFSFASFP